MRKKILIIMAGVMLFTVGCGESESGGSVGKNNLNNTQHESDRYVDEEYESGFGDAYATEYSTEEYVYDDAGAEYNSDGVEENYDKSEAVNASGNAQNSSTDKLNTEMLVYRGSLSIDTLDFDASVSNFKSILSGKGGFVEYESYTDNYSTSGYYAVTDSNKHNTYTATVRVPSSEYDAIMNSATELGDVRSRYSNATNVTQQYNTYQSQLEIYEAEYTRYLSLLENATDDEYALQIENELFDIQIQIAELKSGISNIENDVAYSYIDISIKEVSEYTQEPEKTDTFFDRLKNTCRDSWDEFLEVLEDIVFYIIMNIYYILLILIIVLVLWIFLKKRKRKRAKTENKAELKSEAELKNEANPENRAGGNQG